MRAPPCACWTRPTRPGARGRGVDRPDAHAVLRLEQVRVDARAERAQAVLPRRAARGRGGPRRPAASWPSRIPGSALEREARADGFRAVLHGRETIGGRYSALSNFGMAPGAVAGVDVVAMLERARRAAEACGPGVRGGQNPGVVLGAVLGVCALAGRDKVTLVASPGIADFGAWLEQLLAESTGKDGKGLIPVDAEPLGRAGGLRRGPAVRATCGSPARTGCGPGRGDRRARRMPGTRSCGSTCPTASTWGRSSSCGSSRPPSQARCSASTRSTSPTSRPPR